MFRQFAGARRYIYNHFLARRKAHYEATGQTLSLNQLYAELTTLKREPAMAWLREMDSQALQQAIRDLERAFVNFFERRAKFPRFKAKKRERPSFRIPQRVSIVDGQLSVPKVGLVKLVLHRPVAGLVKGPTFTQDVTGAWYVSLVTHFELPDLAPPPPARERTVGVDLGLNDLAVLSDSPRPQRRTPMHDPEHGRFALAERYGRRFQQTFIGEKTYRDLGVIGGARVFLARSEMGAGGLGGSLLTVARRRPASPRRSGAARSLAPSCAWS